MEKVFLACAIVFTMLSCIGVTLRIMDRAPWLRRIPVITAYLEALFCIAALISFLSTHTLPPDGQFSHGFLACIITAIFASIVAIMLTIDWWRGFPSAGLSATLKALIISSFVMTIIIIIGAAIYSSLEEWSFDEAVNFCIVSFATIGYGNLSPKTAAGQIIFFFYGLLGISSVGFFVVSLRNAVIEQFHWRLVDRFSKPAHLTRVQTRMSAKDISFPLARFEEEQRVKRVVKRKMILRMICIWIVMWFGGAGVFCAFEPWTFLESLYFCFVTLTTIGFGDYVPKEPGSIEFWSVYVFVGLAVFAYILSLSSESMAAHIHLVDDQDEDDDASMYGWERNEDPNAPLTTRSAILGLEGLKWLNNQHLIQQQGSNPDLQITDGDSKTVNSNAVVNSSNGPDSNSTNNETNTNPNDEFYGTTPSPLQRERANTNTNTGNRKNSSGRILMVSAKERKQMLQAEYYAAQSLPTAAIRFVDIKGMPHQRTIRGSFSGPSGSGSGSGTDALDDAKQQQHTLQTYGTMGYFGTSGQRDLAQASLPRWNSLRSFGNEAGARTGIGGAGTDQSGDIYGPSVQNTVQTRQLQHRPLIKFGAPGDSLQRGGGLGGGLTGGHGYIQLDSSEYDSRRRESASESRSGYIPSCMDLFRQNNLPNNTSSRSVIDQNNNSTQDLSVAQGEGKGGEQSNTQVRSNSWDQSASHQRSGPSQNEIHRISEDANALQGPTFNPTFTSHPSDNSDNVKMDNSPDHGNTASSSIPETALLQKTNTENFAFTPITTEESNTGFPRAQPTSASSSGAALEPFSHREERVAPDEASRSYTPAPPSVSNTNPNNLFLGGGAGAGYGQHAYGVPRFDSKHAATNNATNNATATAANTVTANDSNHGNAAPQIAHFDDDDDNNNDNNRYTMHAPSTQAPLSLFSNHPQSTLNNVRPSPAGSARSSRPSSVLMTIFDEPVIMENIPGSSASRSRPGSRTISRNNSNSRTAAAAAAAAVAATRSRSSRSSSDAMLQQQNVTTHPTPSNIESMDVGPFNEVRYPGELPQFEDDVDLNHIEPNSQQIQNEQERQQELSRREREIEARLARLGAKGRMESYQ
ncbi:hypothetical protein BCR41DRAFT_202056 [Lobosporangium transversale]|uniref:Potassium channel domain-containing protein n=1 Tax=Lobosporangium transversale TaxID=64571 RepID=A0A1Y2GXT5_9FUNG|nr:hypothetical protein BCR41DRAFT_202056 [Lobosporangium transversale]ORZ26581.1 hypothetical protein BCR41DRAFT_202056 [Lobosporangium transversale]|eukprot:XP_021884344.1 hypothetical protein BCR41DRAFT_202056 [Lobosporangium transversale]